MDTNFCHVSLDLVSVGGTPESPKLYKSEDIVQAISDYEYLMDGLKDPEGNEVPPICGLLSSVFMHRNKWVLNCGWSNVQGGSIKMWYMKKVLPYMKYL